MRSSSALSLKKSLSKTDNTERKSESLLNTWWRNISYTSPHIFTQDPSIVSVLSIQEGYKLSTEISSFQLFTKELKGAWLLLSVVLQQNGNNGNNACEASVTSTKKTLSHRAQYI